MKKPSLLLAAALALLLGAALYAHSQSLPRNGQIIYGQFNPAASPTLGSGGSYPLRVDSNGNLIVSGSSGGGGAPTGAAGGDLNGTYPNPGVARIQGFPISAATPTIGCAVQGVAGGYACRPTPTVVATPTLPLAGANGGTGSALGAQSAHTVNAPAWSATITCDWSLGDICAPTAASGSSTTFTFTNPTTNSLYTIYLQNGSNNVAITWPGTVKGTTGEINIPASTNNTFGAGSTSFIIFQFWWDGTNYVYLPNYKSSFTTLTGTKLNVGTSGLQINGDTTITAAPRASYAFDVSEGAALPGTGVLIDCDFIEKALTVTKLTLSTALFTCSVNPTVLVEDCGTTVNSCSSPTTIGTSSITAAGVQNVTISNAAVAATHYVCMNISAGTCALLDASYKMTTKLQ